MKKVLVCGGCGYIGSHTVVDLLQKGYEVVSIDNMHNAEDDVVQRIKNITGKSFDNHVIDITNRKSLGSFFMNQNNIDGIIHFAAFKSVEESVKDPISYYKNNIIGLINLLEACKTNNIQHFIFSSSCTVYGEPNIIPVEESTPIQEATSPYGCTKQIGETLLQDYAKNTLDFHCILLRYFNPAGAHESGLIGEAARNKAINLVPVITETAIGKRKDMKVFGTDYKTRDGTCIRDYIHIMDLAEAHTLALEYLAEGKNNKASEVFNLGIGQGVTVLEAIHAFERVSGMNLQYELTERRPGDVPAIYSDYTLAKEKLGWHPKRDIEDIMDSAWKWEKARSNQD